MLALTFTESDGMLEPVLAREGTGKTATDARSELGEVKRRNERGVGGNECFLVTHRSSMAGSNAVAVRPSSVSSGLSVGAGGAASAAPASGAAAAAAASSGADMVDGSVCCERLCEEKGR